MHTEAFGEFARAAPRLAAQGRTHGRQTGLMAQLQGDGTEVHVLADIVVRQARRVQLDHVHYAVTPMGGMFAQPAA